MTSQVKLPAKPATGRARARRMINSACCGPDAAGKGVLNDQGQAVGCGHAGGGGGRGVGERIGGCRAMRQRARRFRVLETGVRRGGQGQGRRRHRRRRADATNYASATIAADRSQHSFGLSLDQFLAKRGASTIVARGRSLKQSQAALFASIQQRYGVPPGPLIAIWGMETGFGSQRGNQNMLSSIATLAYDCRRPEFFTDQLYAALKLIDRGALRPAPAGRCTAKSARPSSCPRTSWPTAPAISTSPPTR